MLDPSQPVSELPGVVAYRDDRRPSRIYAYPSAPRLARDPSGKPAISLLLYGKKTSGAFQLTGGFLNLTTTLELSASESEHLRKRLQQNLSPKESSTIELISPAWTTGTVTVRLGDGLELRGRPSLLSANEAALSLSLTADQASQLQRLWEDGLPDAKIRYELQTEAARRENYKNTTEASGTKTARGSQTTYHTQSSFDASLTQAVPFFVQVEGSLGISASDLRDQTQEINL